MTALCLLMFAEFAFQDFAAPRGVQLVSSASTPGRVLRLTPAENDKVGAAWFTAKQSVANGFDTAFQFQLTDQGGLGDGADGFAFVIQGVGADAIAGHGASGGFSLGDGTGDLSKPGIPNSVAVFFDTFKNREEKDPSDNYVSISTIGKLGGTQWPPARLAMVKKLKVKLKDGKVHQARIVYQPPVMTIYLDGAGVLSSPVDLASVVDERGSAYVGFTASTGGGFENHDIVSWSFRSAEIVSSDLWQSSSTISYVAAACLEGKNLCTPDRVIVEDKGGGQYHIVLPANLDWGASVPNPAGTQVSISNAHGTACWDFEGLGAEGCSGPKGAILTREREGRTYFTVKDPGRRYEDNQGYFEFDVVVP